MLLVASWPLLLSVTVSACKVIVPAWPANSREVETVPPFTVIVGARRSIFPALPSAKNWLLLSSRAPLVTSIECPVMEIFPALPVNDGSSNPAVVFEKIPLSTAPPNGSISCPVTKTDPFALIVMSPPRPNPSGRRTDDLATLRDGKILNNHQDRTRWPACIG